MNVLFERLFIDQSARIYINIMDTNSSAVISEVISKLQGLLGPAPSKSSEPKEANMPEFDANLAKCLDKAKTISPQLTRLTQIYTAAAKTMKAILGFSKTCKKYSPQQEEKLKKKITDLAKDIDQIQKKNAQFSEHCRTFREILQTTCWVFVPTPQFLLKGSIQSADFWALRFQRKKNLDHNQWYKLFQNAVRSLQKFVMPDYAMGITFNFHGEDKWGLLTQSNGNTSSNTVVQAPKQASKPPATVGPVAPVKKQKKKEMLGQNLTIINFQNQVIELKAEEIQMKHGIFFENSTGVHLKVESKFKSMAVSKCNDIVIEMKSCISGIELVNCKNVKIYVKERTPSISVDTSESVNIILNQENLQCEIVSSKASELNISYLKGDGNESKAFLVSSQLVTKWDPTSQKFKTIVYDKFI